MLSLLGSYFYTSEKNEVDKIKLMSKKDAIEYLRATSGPEIVEVFLKLIAEEFYDDETVKRIFEILKEYDAVFDTVGGES